MVDRNGRKIKVGSTIKMLDAMWKVNRIETYRIWVTCINWREAGYIQDKLYNTSPQYIDEVKTNKSHLPMWW